MRLVMSQNVLDFIFNSAKLIPYVTSYQFQGTSGGRVNFLESVAEREIIRSPTTR